jgi:cytochrome b561
LGLVAMTSHDAAGTSIYWQIFIAPVALVSIVAGWRFAGTSHDPRWVYLLKQVLHWGALVLVIRLLYTHNLQDFLNDEQDGFVTIYVLGLTAILSGIYLDWRMALFGLFLLLSGFGMAWIDDNAMLISLIAAAAAVGVVVSLVFRRRGRPELSSA